MDVKKLLNQLIEKLIPVLNKEIPDIIVDAGFDPWPDVSSEDASPGKIDLGICTATAHAKYAIGNMVGLKSLDINGITIDSFDTDGTKIVGKMLVNCVLKSDLSAHLSGKLSASCGIVEESVGISGKVIASACSGSGNANFEAELSKTTQGLNSIEIKKLNLKYQHISVKIDGLGIFNFLLDPLVQIVSVFFGGLITGQIEDLVLDELNKAIKDILPISL